MTGKGGKPNSVFISYAHESDRFRRDVGDLVSRLKALGLDVRSDHEYDPTPPKAGWPNWMRSCVRDVDYVLIVCSPKYLERYEGRAPPNEGNGVNFEGAIITSALMQDGWQNRKFFPLLPDGGSFKDIPLELRAWAKEFVFPSKFGRIAALVSGTSVSTGGAAVSDPGPAPAPDTLRLDRAPDRMRRHEARTTELLTHDGVASFREAMRHI
ncbi:MAG: toll/interleukin-1 receptor domain-containing protein [Phycisphaerae bacterium]|nr:toll/interleukin-1 receptor domain-containing protein [Phycisphaerae bacterium]